MLEKLSFRVVVVVGGLVLATALPVSPARAQRPPAPKQSQRPPKADVDGDKVFDDLEADLGAKADDAPINVIVALRDPATEDRVRGLEGRVGRLRVSHRFDLVDAFSAVATARQARALARQGDVAHVEADSIVRASNDTAQSAFGVTAARAAVPGLDGSGVKVAVIDSGAAISHVDLADNKVVAFRDYVGGRTTPYDDHGHGTHVAATIAGAGVANPAYVGAAPAATLVVAKVLNAAGEGTMSDVTAAIDWAATQGVGVINLSLGASGCADGSDVTSAAVNRAAAAGIVVAVAAGNEGPGTCTVGSPGAATGATTVGAMADLGHGGFDLAYFSSRGRLGSGGAALKPDVVAPGVGIMSADASSTTGYRSMSGTSMATPFVAGVAALMLDNGVAATDVKARLEDTAADWGTPGDDVDFGSGRVDAYRAITGFTDPILRPVHAFRQSSLAGTGATVDYQLDVTDTRFPVAATLVHSGVSAGFAATPDFDLYLYNPSGTELSRGYTNSRQETVSSAPTSMGVYTLRVRSYNGSGPFQLDWSAGTGTAPPPTTTTTIPSTTTTTTASTTSTTTTIPPPTTTTTTPPPTTVPPPPPPAPVSATLAPTSVAPAGDLTTLSADDNRYYTLAAPPLASGTRTSSWDATFTNVPANVTGLTVTYRGKNSIACTQRISLLKAGSWVIGYSGKVSTTEATVSAKPTDAKSYVSGGTVKVRLQCITSAGNFTSYGEMLTLRYDRPVT